MLDLEGLKDSFENYFPTAHVKVLDDYVGTECVPHEPKTIKLKLSRIQGPHRFDISQRTENFISKRDSLHIQLQKPQILN